MTDNLFVVTTDWHLVSDDSEAGGQGETRPGTARAYVAHIRGLQPAGVVDLGDCKDHYGTDAGVTSEHDNYIAYVSNRMPWAQLNPGSAPKPILPGNHDEVHDYSDIGSSTDFSLFDAAFWPAPYHWTCDWAAPKVRFIAIHTAINHGGTTSGFFTLDATERTWLSSQLASLPAGWKAIVCSHAPALSTFGNYIHPQTGGTELMALLAANNAKVVAYLNGHRHHDMSNALQDGIRHISLTSAAYTTATNGGIVPVEYLSASAQLKFHCRLGPPAMFGPYDPASYTPVVVGL